MNKTNIMIAVVILFLIFMIVKAKSSKSSAPVAVAGSKSDPTALVVLYYASWCGHSKNFLPEWEKFSKYASSNMPNIAVGKMVCENGKEKECFQQGVKGYPTVLIYKNKKAETYQGERTADALINYCGQLL
jgi:thiol-disulfide isomerase/thioredoxin